MDKSRDAVVAELTHETAGWMSLGARFSFEQTVHVAIGTTPAGTVTRGREEYMATRHGERKYGQFVAVDGREVCALLGFDETTRCASVRFRPPPLETRQRSITIGRTFLDEDRLGFRALPPPLPYYVGLAPAAEAIRSAEGLGPSRVAGRDCARYLCRSVPGNGTTQELVVHLDAATSFPLKVESFADIVQVASGVPFSVWEAEGLAEAQGFHYAPDSRFTTFAPSPRLQGAPLPQLANRYHAESIHFNSAMPAAAFWPVVEPGVFVNDTIAGRSSYNTPDGKPPAAQTAAAAEAPGLPWAGWAATGAITVGLALLVVGLCRRGRRS